MAQFLKMLSEELTRNIYAQQEQEAEKNKNLSTTSGEKDVEHNHIGYDPFSVYSAGNLIGQGYYSSRKEYINRWRKIAWNSEVDEALYEIINECLVFEEDDDVISLNLDRIELSKKIKEKIQEAFEKVLFLLDFNNRGEELFKKWFIDGQLNVESVYDNKKIKEGIQKLIILSPFNIWKVKNERTHEISYIISDDKPTNNFDKDIEKAKRVFKPEQLTHVNTGLWSEDGKTPMSHLQKIVKIVNQLDLLEDSVVIWHITRSPEKRVFYIDTGNLPKAKAEEYIKKLISKYRQKKVYNVEDGSIENRSKSISILEDFWLPRNAQGRGTQIDTLASQSQGMTDMTHIEYFANKIYKALRVPRSRREQEHRVSIGSTTEVEKDEMNFFKFCLSLRRKFNGIFVDLLKKELLASSVVSLDDWEDIKEHIGFIYANSNPYFEFKNLSLLETRIASASNAMQLVEHDIYSFDYIRREILKQTDEEVKRIDKDREAEKKKFGDPQDQEDGFGGGGYDDEPAEPPEPALPANSDKDDEKAKVKEEKKKEQYLISSLKEEFKKMLTDELPIIIQAQVEKGLRDDKKRKFIDSLKEGEIFSDGLQKFIKINGEIQEYDE